MTIISPETAEKLSASSGSQAPPPSSTEYYSAADAHIRSGDWDAPPSYSVTQSEVSTTESSITDSSVADANERRNSTSSHTRRASSPPVNSGGSSYQLPNVLPSNYIELKQFNNSVRETLVVDPSLQVSAALLNTTQNDSSARKNVYLESMNGSVNADIYLVEPHLGPRLRVTIGLLSRNGSVTGKIFRGNAKVSPFRLDASSSNGSVRIYLPRDFRGPITASTRNGSLKLSDAMKASAMNVGTNSFGGQVRFIGDHSTYIDAQSWTGDAVNMDSMNGSLWLYYDDEQPAPNPVTRFFSSFLP